MSWFTAGPPPAGGIPTFLRAGIPEPPPAPPPPPPKEVTTEADITAVLSSMSLADQLSTLRTVLQRYYQGVLAWPGYHYSERLQPFTLELPNGQKVLANSTFINLLAKHIEQQLLGTTRALFDKYLDYALRFYQNGVFRVVNSVGHEQPIDEHYINDMLRNLIFVVQHFSTSAPEAKEAKGPSFTLTARELIAQLQSNPSGLDAPVFVQGEQLFTGTKIIKLPELIPIDLSNR